MTSIQAHKYREALEENLRPALANGCGIEFMTNGAVITFWRNDTGETICSFSHTDEEDAKERARKDRNNAARRARHQAYLDCGLKRVKGALGGTYYE